MQTGQPLSRLCVLWPESSRKISLWARDWRHSSTRMPNVVNPLLFLTQLWQFLIVNFFFHPNHKIKSKEWFHLSPNRFRVWFVRWAIWNFRHVLDTVSFRYRLWPVTLSSPYIPYMRCPRNVHKKHLIVIAVAQFSIMILLFSEESRSILLSWVLMCN